MCCLSPVCRRGLRETLQRGPQGPVPEVHLEDEDENRRPLPPPVVINPEREDDHPPLLIPEHPDEAMIGIDVRDEQEHEKEHFGVLIEYVGEEEQAHEEEHVGEAMIGFDLREEQRHEEEHVAETIMGFDLMEEQGHDA